jgi:soluble lytic murein transglycosylase-like protein
VLGLVILVGIVVWQLATTEFGGSSPSTPPSPYPGVLLHQTYTVQSGDTISQIAHRFGISQQSILLANHLRNPNRIFVGQQLVVPASNHPRRTQKLIHRIAHRFGLDPSFALAIAWNESGFQQSVTSRTGAIGVMQIEPSTAVQLSVDLGREINLGIARDNVTAGVYYLHYLVGYFHGNEHLAAAAYYEGQGNVIRHRYVSDTRHYVRTVMALRDQFRKGFRPS